MTPQMAAARHWDVIIIGAGMGGGVAGRRLAEKGLSVLFVEKGRRGYRSEAQELSDDVIDPESRLLRGCWPKQVAARINGDDQSFFAAIGCGVGGSSVFYAAALERPERHDLETTSDMEHPTGGWPVGYDAFHPYFEQVEALLEVAGETDPLSSERGSQLRVPPDLTPEEQALFEDLRERGLTPYRAHEGLRRLPGCENCMGRKCPRPCKMDGRSAGVEPALETGQAHLLEQSDVKELIEEQGRIASVLVSTTPAGDVHLAGQVVILAAGALGSPRLLLASQSLHAQGCANSSGWVGRGLMFHLNEIFALWPRRGTPPAGATRVVSFRDLYTHAGQRLGLVQSMGLATNAGRIASYLNVLIDKSWLRRVPRIKKFTMIPALIAERLFGNATVFVGLMEDLAYPDNRVVLHPEDLERPAFEYTISPELRARRSLLRAQLRQRLGRFRTLFLGFKPDLNVGHPSGTLRFGNDPAQSVLNADCRAHDLENLYVADASFMPSSMGVNPSLTIAANALRVADIVAARIQSKTGNSNAA